jgi:hypothetical protein
METLAKGFSQEPEPNKQGLECDLQVETSCQTICLKSTPKGLLSLILITEEEFVNKVPFLLVQETKKKKRDKK